MINERMTFVGYRFCLVSSFHIVRNQFSIYWEIFFYSPDKLPLHRTQRAGRERERERERARERERELLFSWKCFLLAFSFVLLFLLFRSSLRRQGGKIRRKEAWNAARKLTSIFKRCVNTEREIRIRCKNRVQTD